MVAFWTTAVGRFAGMKGSLAHRLVALAAAYAVAFNASAGCCRGISASAAAGFGIIFHRCRRRVLRSRRAGQPAAACPCPGCCAIPGCGAAAPPSDDIAIDRAIGAGVTGPLRVGCRRAARLATGGQHRARAPPSGLIPSSAAIVSLITSPAVRQRPFEWKSTQMKYVTLLVAAALSLTAGATAAEGLRSAISPSPAHGRAQRPRVPPSEAPTCPSPTKPEANGWLAARVQSPAS